MGVLGECGMSQVYRPDIGPPRRVLLGGMDQVLRSDRRCPRPSVTVQNGPFPDVRNS